MHGVHEVAGSSPVVPTNSRMPIDNLESAIQSILDRNRKVETEKAWEVSRARRAVIALTTYIIACVLLWWMGSREFLLQALVPTAGYLLSTLSLPWVKQWWMKRHQGR